MPKTAGGPEFTIVHAATPPLYPVRPVKIYHAAFAGILSILVGIGIALILESMNVTIRSIDEAEKCIGLPVLVTLPLLARPGGHTRRLIDRHPPPRISDARVAKRLYVQYPVEIRPVGEATATRGATSDISATGLCCFVEAAPKLATGGRVKVSLDLPDRPGAALSLEGRVQRSRAAVAGSRFITAAIELDDFNKELADHVDAVTATDADGKAMPLPNHFKVPIRGLRSDLLFLENQGLSMFLVTSCGPGEGKTTITANLALSLAEVNKNVCVIDANLRSPALHHVLGIPNETGLSSILTGEDATGPTRKHGISVLPSGPRVPDSSALLASYDMLQLVKNLQSAFDIILLDSPPLLAGPDAAQLASFAHAAILTLNAGSTTADDLQRAKQILDRSNAKIMGLVMNRFNDQTTSYYAWSAKYGETPTG